MDKKPENQAIKVLTKEELELYWKNFSEAYSEKYSPALSALTISMLTMLEI